MTRLPPHERALFWLGWGAAVTALGGVGILVGSNLATTSKPQNWANLPFLAGLGIAVVGILCLWWALTLHVAHRHAEKHWCFDPSAHIVPPPSPPNQGSGGAPTPTRPVGPSAPPASPQPQLRSALRQIHMEIEVSVRMVETVVETGRYWGPSERLPDQTWKKNRKQLGAIGDVDSPTYEALGIAYTHVERINALQFPRWFSGRQTKPGDNLRQALDDLRVAGEKVRVQLVQLDNPVRLKLGHDDTLVVTTGQRDQPATKRNYEAEVRLEISRRAAVAFRRIQLTETQRDAVEDLILSACKEIGWEEPEQVLIGPVNPEHMELGYAWTDGGYTITNSDISELRKLAKARGEIARQIRDTALGRVFRETYEPKRQAPGIL